MIALPLPSQVEIYFHITPYCLTFDHGVWVIHSALLLRVRCAGAQFSVHEAGRELLNLRLPEQERQVRLLAVKMVIQQKPFVQ